MIIHIITHNMYKYYNVFYTDRYSYTSTGYSVPHDKCLQYSTVSCTLSLRAVTIKERLKKIVFKLKNEEIIISKVY